MRPANATLAVAKQETSAPAAYEAALPMELEPRSSIEGQRDHYNRVYAESGSEHPPANEFLLYCLDLIDAQRQHEAEAGKRADTAANAETALTALDIAMGDGRNTIALAQRGYRTTGFDMSDVGVNRARKRAADLGLTIEANVSYFDDRYLQPEHWDVVAMMYFGVDDRALESLKNAIKPGGYLIIEFSTSFPDAPRRAGDSTLNWTLHRYDDWEIIHYEYAIGPVQWTQKRPVDNVDAPRIRVLARKPAAR